MATLIYSASDASVVRYVGATTEPLAQRRAKHKWEALKRKAGNAFHAALRGDFAAFSFRPILVCEDADAAQYEAAVIKAFGADLNKCDPRDHMASLNEFRPRGEKHGSAKLTAENVAEIRASAAPSRTVAKLFGVNKSTVLRIRSGENWKENHHGC